MAISKISKFVRRVKRPYGVCVKLTAVVILGLCFIFVWSVFSTSSNNLTSQRSTFGKIAEPVSSKGKVMDSKSLSKKKEVENRKRNKEIRKVEFESGLDGKVEKIVNVSVPVSGRSVNGHNSKKKNDKKMNGDREKNDKVKLPVEKEKNDEDGSENVELQKENKEDDKEEEGIEEEIVVGDNEAEPDFIVGMEDESMENEDEDSDESTSKKKRKIKGPLFDPKAHYSWKSCSTRSKYNYIPCIDIEVSSGKMQSYRYRERSCPRLPPMCLVPLPHGEYSSPVHWPESKSKVMYNNVAHPRLTAFIKKNSWLVESDEYLTFPENQTKFKGGVLQYLESIEEMVPDIEWGKNIRIVLDIGSRDSSFGASLVEKEVLTLSLGLKDDLVDLTQISLERGFPAFVSPFENRRLPFPSAVFDAIHCSGCSIPWHSKGGKLLLEMNRILRPNGYFILSTKHDDIEEFEAMSTLTASICWYILAHKTDEVSEVGVKIYQKPESNAIYSLRRRNIPPICKENENPDAAWYVSLKTCLHGIPESVEQRGTEWPEEWPKRLEIFPDWLDIKEKLIADTAHWKSIVEKSYLTGMGIDWSSIRNIMDMKAIYGGFAAALSPQKVWVMNVIPVHAPDTLPVIYERGLAGIYHDWCESFGTYPRSYDLLHADHLFSRLKNRCKQPVGIIVEMDRILRPGGWAIIREKMEILEPVEGILRSLHWDIRMTYTQDKEGILCAQKTLWRP